MDDGATRRPHTYPNKNRSMVNKKGYIKTLEAVIAIIIVIMVGYILIPRPTEPTPEVPSVVKGVQKVMVQSIQFNEGIRAKLTARNLPLPNQPEGQALIKDVNDSIARVIYPSNSPLNYDYSCMICSNPGTCLAKLPLEKSIYVTDVLIASSTGQQNPRIIRIWLWNKPTSEEDKVLGEDNEKIDVYNDCKIKIETT